MDTFVKVIARSAYGQMWAVYAVDQTKLSLVDCSPSTGLLGQSQVASFDGWSLEAAEDQVQAWNEAGSGHEYDGCHACTLFVEINAARHTARRARRISPPATLFDSGLWWAEEEDSDGTPLTASGKTENEAIENLRAARL